MVVIAKNWAPIDHSALPSYPHKNWCCWKVNQLRNTNSMKFTSFGSIEYRLACIWTFSSSKTNLLFSWCRDCPRLMKIHFTHVMVAQWTTIKVKMIWQKRESISLVFGHDLHNVYGHTVIVKSPLHDTNASNLLRKAWLIIEMLLLGIHFF